MICFNCGYKFPSSDVKGCHLCGMKTPLKCFSCGSPNPLLAKFCFNCGAQIANPDVQSSVQNFDTLPENRKNVAVIFADVSGFTALSEKLDPEEVREIINECFDYITKPVYELEGTIDKYIGDCVMILFGAKYSHSDDPKRAVMCAVKMQDLIKEFSKERLSGKGLTLSLSIGVNYGLVVTGSVGNYFDKDYTVMGDTVNTAQRLQSNAGSGTILVSESVYMETKDMFIYSEAKKIAVKNKEKPVICYSPTSLNMESIDDNILLVEREDEINFLGSVYNGAECARYITVTGESGVGKTSLIKTFLSTLESDVKKVWVDCSSMYQCRVYYVISNILLGIMNINSEDSSRIKKNRLMSYIDYILMGYSEEKILRNCNFLSLVMGLDRDNDFQNILNSMNYDDIEREVLGQLSIFFTALCKKHEIIFIVDDIHWADSNSVNILKKLIVLLSDVKPLFLFTSRYEMEDLKVVEKDKSCTLKLEKLSEGGIRNLVSQLLNSSNIDKSLFDEIMKFTNGNPLYIKEFINALKRTGKYSVKDDTAYIDESAAASLPNTLERVILANFDELDNDAVKFLQVASVIGKEFNMSWVTGLLDDNIDIKNILKSINELNIIFLKSAHSSSGVADKVYGFNQDTFREVIYNSILNRDKKEFHKGIGELIEAKYSNDLENYYEILCIHFEMAGLTKKTIEYLYKTALKYKSDFVLSSSLEYFNRFLDTANVIHQDKLDSRVVRAFLDIGYIYTVTANYDKALDYLNKALEIAVLSDDIFSIKLKVAGIHKEKADYDNALQIIDEIEPRISPKNSIYGQLLQLKCSILRMLGNPMALNIAKKSEKILLKAKEYENLSETMSQAAGIYFTNGDLENSLFYLNKAYRYAEKTNNLRIMSRISGNIGIIYHSSGRVSKALEYFSKFIEISEKISDVQSLASGNINLGILFMEKGLFNKAELLFNEVLNTSKKVSLTYGLCLALLNLGDLMYERGEYATAFGKYGQSLEIAKRHSLPCEEGINYIGLVKLHLKTMSYDGIPEMLEKAYKIFTDCDEVSYISDYFKYKGVYELLNNNPVNALDYCEKSISAAEEAKNDMKRLKAIRFKGNILMLTGEYKNALDLYSKSISFAEQLESDYEMAKGYYRKSVVLTHLNSNSAAEEFLFKAKEAIKRVDKCRWTAVIGDQIIK